MALATGSPSSEKPEAGYFFADPLTVSVREVESWNRDQKLNGRVVRS